MFGYVLPRKDKLSERALNQYRAAYCGLCRSLKKRYGFHARFLVNYDMTFLYFLLQNDGQEASKCFCPARVFCKKNCLPNDPVMAYAADLTVLLSYWKLRDAEQDGKFFKKLGAKSIKLLFLRAYHKAAKRLPEADAIFSEQLAKLQKLEQEQCASIDKSADAFATMLHGCASCVEDEKERRKIEFLLYHVGRFLYLADALEDLQKDVKADAYNPLRYRYALTDGKLTKEDQEEFLLSVDSSVAMAASALELLDGSVDRELLQNIIYYGLPAVLKSVAEGTFRKRGKKQ